MTGIGTGFLNQTRRLFLRRRYQAMIILLFVMSFLGMEVYHQKVVYKFPVAVIDQDNSKISRTLHTFFASTPEIAVYNEPIESIEEARALLFRSKIEALILIPPDFSQAIKTGDQARILVMIDASNIMIGKNIAKAVNKCIATVSAGIQMTLAKKFKVPSDQALAAIMPITVNENLSFNPFTNYALYLVPAMILFFLHVFILIVVISCFLPGQQPGSLQEWIGAMAAVFVWGFLMALVFIYIYLPIEGIYSVSGFFMLLPALSFFLLLDILMAVALGTVIPKPFVALETTVILGMLSLMLSGVTWPTDMFPALLAWISQWIPFTPFARGIRMLLHFSVELDQMSGIYLLYARQLILFSVMIGSGVLIRRFVVRRRADAK